MYSSHFMHRLSSKKRAKKIAELIQVKPMINSAKFSITFILLNFKKAL